MKKFSIILAVDNENGLGKDGKLMWSIPEDMKFFKEKTTTTKNPKLQNAVIMGRKTWESLPRGYKPLPGRVNYVLSRKVENNTLGESGEIYFSDLFQSIKAISQDEKIENIFVIGGAEIYNIAVKSPCLESAYITRIYDKYHCDTFFDGLPKGFEETYVSPKKIYKDIEYEFYTYKKKYTLLQKIKSFLK